MDTRESVIRGELEQARALLLEIRKGTALLRLGQRVLTDRRFQLGEILSRVRKRFPASGKGAAGWGEFCKELGLSKDSAQRYIEIADQVAARPELADRRSFQEIYLELGLNVPPPQERAPPLRFAAVTAADVVPDRTLPPAESTVLIEDVTDESHRGRPPLSERDRRNDIYMVRLNTDETVRLRRLSGLLDMRDAEVFREGLLALEEREAQKALPPPRPVAQPAARKAR